MKRRAIASFFFAAILSCSAAALAEPESRPAKKEFTVDWPNLLGPLGTGVYPETGLQLTWPPNEPPIRWVRNLGESYSPPVAANGKLIVFHRVRDQEIVACWNAETSDRIWAMAYPTKYEDRYQYDGGPRSSPAIDGDRVYTFGAEGVFTCFALDSGEIKWQRQLNQEYGYEQNFFGVAVSPYIEGDLVLLNIGDTEKGSVVGLNKFTGKTVWQVPTGGGGYSTPIVAPIRGERLAFFFTRDGLSVIEPGAGVERFTYPFRSKIHESVVTATPIVVDDVVFLSAAYNVGAVSLRVTPNGLEEIWKDRKSMQNHWATSIYHEGSVYGMDGRHKAGSNLRCIDWATGEVRWTAEEGLGRASFIMADGHLIAVGEDGNLAIVEVNPDKYVEKFRMKILRYPCWTPPILARGLLFLRNERSIICIDLRPGAKMAGG